MIWWAGREEQWEQLGTAGGKPRPDLRDPDGGGVPQQLCRRPVPLRRGEAPFASRVATGILTFLVRGEF